MIKRGHKLGFTVVELMIVIIVMALLATMIALAYGNVQTQARDTQVRDAADKYVDALRLWMAYHNGNMPQGGNIAAASVPDENLGCSGGGSSGWANGNYTNTTYQCTKGLALQTFGYLPADFFDNLPPNPKYNTNKTNFMIYPRGGKWYLFYALEAPTAAEESAMNALRAGWPQAETNYSSYGMRAYQEITNF